MQDSVKTKAISVTPIPSFKVKSTEVRDEIVQMRREADPAVPSVDLYLRAGEALALLRYQISLMQEAEKLFRSEIILEIQANPTLLEGKVTEKTTEAFYRSQEAFVELNLNISKWERDAAIVKLYFDLAASAVLNSQSVPWSATCTTISASGTSSEVADATT